MPKATEGAEIGNAFAGMTGQHGGIERIALRTITALARALVLLLRLGRLFHFSVG